jgi:hypothetical protein
LMGESSILIEESGSQAILIIEAHKRSKNE